MAETLTLFLDLGDLLTKAIAADETGTEEFGFPSVVARQLLGETEHADLLFDVHEKLPRLADFDASNYPRTRSHPGAKAFLSSADPAAGARFAGWVAAAYGSDRQLLGNHASAENIDALVRKALMRCAGDHRRAELVFVVDAGPKASAITRYAETPSRDVEFLARRFQQAEPRRVQLKILGRVVDAASAAAAALPPELGVERVDRVLLIDIGYLRTKLAIVSSEGCEYQEQHDGLGVANCVLRILRDGQEQGLVEDEIAVIRALEGAQSTIEVAGRRFEIGGPLESAKRVLCDELARVLRRAVMQHYSRSGEMCRAAAIVGGGAAVVGADLAARLEASDLGLGAVWTTADTRFLLLRGARKLAASER